ncbi:MAG: sigma-70 family RNA polymerase sigma factor [Methyloprofundus sp.]|nr:sigma-70 family RNA polymerase sigma factor [Methyloprofundus sp.]
MIPNNNYQRPHAISYVNPEIDQFIQDNVSRMLSMPWINAPIAMDKKSFVNISNISANNHQFIAESGASSEDQADDTKSIHFKALSPEQLMQHAKQMELARATLSKEFVYSRLGLQAIAEVFFLTQKQGTEVSELLNKNNSDAEQAIQDDNFVQDTAKQMESKLISCFQVIQGAHIGPGSALSITEVRQYLAEIHFLPNFLQQVFFVVVDLADKSLATTALQNWLNACDVLLQEMLSARQLMINANLKLVPYIAQQYKHHSLAFSDLIQDGNIGLIKAVDRFDAQRDIRFSTYASYWIKQTISRSIVRQEKIVRLPFNLAAKAPLVLKTMRSVLSETSQWPSIYKLAELCAMPEEDVLAIVNNYQPSTSLNQSIDDSEEMPELISTLEQHHYPQPLNSLLASDLQNFLRGAIAILSAREADIICRRFGLENTPEMTLQDIASQLGLTRERVRQIQNGALIKLKKQFSHDLCFKEWQ